MRKNLDKLYHLRRFDFYGDGKTDIAVYRASTGGWFVILSSGATPFGVGWGGDVTDIPVTTNPASYMP